MIYLYKKTHKVTGLQYLGKTSRPDPYTYPGSGKRWRAHLEKHGYEFDTEILAESTDPTEIVRMGLHYSNLWNVVADENWANLKPESGDGGTFTHTAEAKKKIGDARRGKANGFRGKSYEEIQKDTTAAQKRRENHSKLMLENNPFKGKSHSNETRQQMVESAKLRATLSDEDRKARWGHHKGKPWSEARRAAQLEKKLNKGKTMNPFRDQEKFMRACDQTVGQVNEQQFDLYKNLIEEEFDELTLAEMAKDRVEQLDALVDILVVTIGAIHSMGADAEGAWKEVMKTNFAKIDHKTGKVRKREDGKVLKPVGWEAPDLASFLKNQ